MQRGWLAGVAIVLNVLALQATASSPRQPCEIDPALQAAVAEVRRAQHIPVAAFALVCAAPIQPSVGPSVAPSVAISVLGAPEHTPFRWGSITKSVTALTLLRTLQEHGVSEETGVAEHVSPRLWQNPWSDTDPLRIVHLLQLTAGLPDLAAAEFDSNVPLSLDTALALAPKQRTLLWPPGWHHSYTNASLGLTQALLHALTGEAYAATVARHVFDPLQMHRAGFTPDIRVRGVPLPGGFRADGATPIPYWHMTYPAYGALNAPLQDMTRWLAALMQAGAGLDSDEHAAMFTPRASLGARAGFDFEYASGVYPRVRSGLEWWVHGGDADGYLSRMAMLRPQRRGYLAVINSDNPPALRQIERLLERHLSRDVPRPEPEITPPVTGLATFAGTYYPATTRFGVTRWQDGAAPTARITVLPDGAGLLFAREQSETRLLPAGDRQFRRPGDPRATVVFVTTGKQHFMQGELGNYVRQPQTLMPPATTN